MLCHKPCQYQGANELTIKRVVAHIFRFCCTGEPRARSHCFIDWSSYIAAGNSFVLNRPISPKLQLLSGHTAEHSLAVYRALALSDVAEEYEAAMRTFPVR